MTSDNAIDKAISDILIAADSRAAILHFREYVRQFHIDTFSSGEIDIANRKRVVFHTMEWPQDWQDYYFNSDMLERDPVVEALANIHSAFTWAELRTIRGLDIAGTEALNKIAAAGWTDGLVVPLARAGTHYGIVSLVTRNHIIDPSEKTALTAISVVFHERIRALVLKEGFEIPPCGLTRREIECIRMIAAGLSDEKAGKELGISGSTVHEHAERARRKLDAKNRAQLAAIAVSFGIIAV
jgi:DNA-binding CsgD family transcriptional regulator